MANFTFPCKMRIAISQLRLDCTVKRKMGIRVPISMNQRRTINILLSLGKMPNWRHVPSVRVYFIQENCAIMMEKVSCVNGAGLNVLIENIRNKMDIMQTCALGFRQTCPLGQLVWLITVYSTITFECTLTIGGFLPPTVI